MNLRFQAAWELHLLFTSHKIPYAIVGGMAVPRWGEPRVTEDVDLVVMPPDTDMESISRLVLAHYPSRVSDPVALARRARVILIRLPNGCDVDISVGLPGFEDEVLHRVTRFELEPGKVVRVCSAEDLIIYKSVAGRPKDIQDIEGIILRQKGKLDLAYIRRWLREYAVLADDPEITARFERAWRALGPKRPRAPRS